LPEQALLFPLFVLTQKVEQKGFLSYSSFALTQKKQKVKDSANAPRACPGHATATV
jgi:hypothetical protein